MTLRAAAALALSIGGSLPAQQTIRIGIGEGYPYHGFDEAGTPRGFAVDMLTAAAAKRGVSLQWMVLRADGADALKQGTVDLVPVVTGSVRLVYPQVVLSRPWLRARYVRVSLHQEPPISRQQIATLGLPAGMYVQSLADRLFPQARKPVSGSYPDLWTALCSGQVQGVLAEIRLLRHLTMSPVPACVGKAYTVDGLPGPPTPLFVAARAGLAPLPDQLVDEMDRMILEGAMQPILDRWVYFGIADDILSYRREALQRRNLLLIVATGLVTALSLIGLLLQARRLRRSAREASHARHRLERILSSIREVVWSRTSGVQPQITLSAAASEHAAALPEQSTVTEASYVSQMPATDRERFLAAIAAAERGEQTSLRYRLLRPNGEVRWLLDRIVPEKNAQGQVRRIDGVALDITDQVNAEEALRRNELRFRTLLEGGGDVISLYGPDGRLHFASPSAAHVLGYEPGELLGRTIFHLLYPEDRSTIREALQTLMQSAGGALTLECRLLHKDGRVLHAECRGRNLLDDPNVGGIVFVTRDVTARKQAQAERERLIAELEARNTELERFTYTVSHDLKAPLITIRGFLSYVRRALDAGNVAAAAADLHRIETAAGRLEALLTGLLQLSRAGRSVGPRRPVALGDIAREAIEQCAGAIAARAVSIHLQPDLPIVLADRSRIVQVFQNLLDNAVKFTYNQGNPEVRIGARSVGRETILYVSDNGVGIPAKYRDRVFGLFEKLVPSTDGAGIGLAVCKRLVESHGGRIWVESDGEGQGATFCFTLPTPAGPRE